MNLLDRYLPKVPLLPPPQWWVEEPMINEDVFEKIRSLKRTGLGAARIGKALSLDPKTVRRYLAMPEFVPYRREAPVSRMLKGLEDWLTQRAPEVDFNGQVLCEEARLKGFTGSYGTIKRFLRPLRLKERQRVEATVRFETPPGLQGQVDWGSALVWLGEARVRVHFFVFVLGFSRRMYARGYANERRHHVIDGHQRAFAWFGGYPREILYDNARTMIMTERLAENRLNPLFKDFADHYGFEPRFCRPYRPRTKGKVESGVKYLKRNFLKGRRFRDLEDLNRALEAWLVEVADRRVHGTTHEIPAERFGREREALLPLSPVRPWQPDSEHERRVANDGRIDFEANRYGVPLVFVGENVLVETAGGDIAISKNGTPIVRHDRALGKHQDTPCPAKLEQAFPERSPSLLPPKHDPRWQDEEVEIRGLDVYERAAAAEAVA